MEKVQEKKNTVHTQDGAEVYTHDIYYFADEYIENELGGDRKEVTDSFVDMILYIADRIEKPSNDDIELLDDIFNIYLRLCTKYRVLPTLEIFSLLVKINRTTFTDWSNGEYRVSTAHGNTVKKWFNVCKSLALNRLHNKGGTDANLIFVMKAAYGMAETAPVQIADRHKDILTELPRLDGVQEVKAIEGRESP